MIIRPIKQSFKKQGTYYEQIIREEDWCIYSLKYDTDSAIIGYDVVRVCRRSLNTINALRTNRCKGNMASEYEGFECYPSSSQWGYCAWSFTTLKSAKLKYNEMITKTAERQLSYA